MESFGLATMGKHEPMTAKAIANKIKAKGLQKIKYYCEMCKKQCRDDNGFKCHIMSESHQRQALIVSENPEKFVSDFSKQFMDGFMYILRARYRTKRILANTVFQEYIKERDHIHMNGTRWTSLSEQNHLYLYITTTQARSVHCQTFVSAASQRLLTLGKLLFPGKTRANDRNIKTS